MEMTGLREGDCSYHWHWPCPEGKPSWIAYVIAIMNPWIHVSCSYRRLLEPKILKLVHPEGLLVFS